MTWIHLEQTSAVYRRTFGSIAALNCSPCDHNECVRLGLRPRLEVVLQYCRRAECT